MLVHKTLNDSLLDKVPLFDFISLQPKHLAFVVIVSVIRDRFLNNGHDLTLQCRSVKAPLSKTAVLSYVAILLLPIAVFYWFLPFWSQLSIGSDYTIFSIQSQLELQYSLFHGTFPLYSPGFAMGRASAALTLGQLYHPISYLAAHMPGYWQGLALDWNTFFRLLSLGVCQVVLFILFRHLNIMALPAFILSFLAVYNLRMLVMKVGLNIGSGNPLTSVVYELSE